MYIADLFKAAKSKNQYCDREGSTIPAGPPKSPARTSPRLWSGQASSAVELPLRLHHHGHHDHDRHPPMISGDHARDHDRQGLLGMPPMMMIASDRCTEAPTPAPIHSGERGARGIREEKLPGGGPSCNG